jgi:hypothetical protein
MNTRHWSVVTAVALLLGTGSAALALRDAPAQDKPKQPAAPAAPAAADAQAMTGPTPGPEHKLLEKWVGNWDCDIEMYMDPAKPPEKSKGKNVAKLACGGLWLVTDFEGAMMGGPFTGHEVMGYDPPAKKYVFTWVDSWITNLDNGEGSYDAKTNTMNTTMSVRGMTGAMTTSRETDVWKDADTHEWTMFQNGPDGKELKLVAIVYRRRK